MAEARRRRSVSATLLGELLERQLAELAGAGRSTWSTSAAAPAAWPPRWPPGATG